MKIPTKRIDLSALGYEGYWVEMPRSVKEGWINDFAKMARGSGSNGNGSAPDEDDTAEVAETGRRANLQMLDLVTAWNVDDDAGKVLPLTSTLKSDEAKEKVIAEIPVDVLAHLAQSLVEGQQTPEKVRDFSNRS